MTSSLLALEVVPVENDPRDFSRHKPKQITGLWTSTWDTQEQTSEWIEWCRGENFGTPDTDYWHLLTPTPDSRILVIDGMSALLAALDFYFYDPYGRTDRDSYFRSFDFEAMSKDYDALHLTSEAARKLDHMPVNMWAWDVESTVWFRWCFSEVRTISPVERRVRP